MNLITPELKDRMLEKLICLEAPTINIDDTAKELGVSPSWVTMMIHQFVELQLCRATFFIGGNIRIVIRAEAHEMALRGGFTAREKYLKDSIDKLERELKQLQADFPDRAERFANILSGISAVVSLFR